MCTLCHCAQCATIAAGGTHIVYQSTKALLTIYRTVVGVTHQIYVSRPPPPLYPPHPPLAHCFVMRAATKKNLSQLYLSLTYCSWQNGQVPAKAGAESVDSDADCQGRSQRCGSYTVRWSSVGERNSGKLHMSRSLLTSHFSGTVIALHDLHWKQPRYSDPMFIQISGSQIQYPFRYH